jgi:LPXTG-motif cell wall-anchored protein
VPSPVAPEQPKVLPKTASELPLAAWCGAALVLAGALLRRKTA